MIQPVNTDQVLESINSFIAGINFNEPTWDLFIILFFLGGAFLYGLTLGRDRIILVLISIYMALAVLHAMPFLDNIAPVEYGPNNIFVFRIIIFLAIFVVLFGVLSRCTALRSLTQSDSPGAWWHVIVFSILHVGLLASITISFIPKEFHQHLSLITKQWFVGEQAEFFWIIAPIIAFVFIRGDDGED